MVTKEMASTDIKIEAQRFLREGCCLNICCDEEVDNCYMSFMVDEDDDLEVEIEHDGHPSLYKDYYVTIFKIPRHKLDASGAVVIIGWYAWQPSLTSTGEIVLQDKTEIQFWDHVAALYSKLPTWMFEYSDDYYADAETNSNPDDCDCPTKTIMQQGCQCGGV